MNTLGADFDDDVDSLEWIQWAYCLMSWGLAPLGQVGFERAPDTTSTIRTVECEDVSGRKWLVRYSSDDEPGTNQFIWAEDDPSERYWYPEDPKVSPEWKKEMRRLRMESHNLEAKIFRTIQKLMKTGWAEIGQEMDKSPSSRSPE